MDGVGLCFNFTEPSTRTPDPSTAVPTLTLLGVHEFVSKQVDKALNERSHVISSSFQLSVLIRREYPWVSSLGIHPDFNSVFVSPTRERTFGVDHCYTESFDPSRTSEPNGIPNHIIRDVCFIGKSHLLHLPVVDRISECLLLPSKRFSHLCDSLFACFLSATKRRLSRLGLPPFCKWLFMRVHETISHTHFQKCSFWGLDTKHSFSDLTWFLRFSPSINHKIPCQPNELP